MNPIQLMIADRPMSRVQVSLIVLTGAIMAVDGFDFLSVALVSKALAAAWSLHPPQIGLIFAAGTTGMTLGTFFLSPLADIWGRRLAIITCLIIISTGMLFCSTADSFPLFVGARVLTGLGVGGLGTHVAVLAFEYASYKRRELALAVTIIGFTVGAAIGGPLAIALLKWFDWRAVFVVGGVLSLAMIPLCWRWLFESLVFLSERPRPDSLVRINRVLRAMNMDPIRELPVERAAGQPQRVFLRSIFADGYGLPLLVLSATYLCHMSTFYFAISWIPKILQDAGHSDALALTTSSFVSIGGVIGAATIGLIAHRIGVRTATILLLACICAFVILFGLGAAHILLIYTISGPLGFVLYGGSVALYSILVATFPPAIRTTCVGIAQGVGRLGSIAGPYLAGLLLSQSDGIFKTCLILALPAGLASLLVAGQRLFTLGAVARQPAVE